MELTRLAASTLLATFVLLLYWTTSSAQSQDLASPDHSLSFRVKRDQPFETREKVRATFDVVKDTLSAVKDVSDAKKWADSSKQVLKKLANFASMAPGCVGAIFSVVNMVLAFIPQDDPVLNAVKEGFAEVNRKLDSISIQISNLATDVEWFNYASVYSQDEVRILSAWRKFNDFRENSELAQSQDEKLRQAEIFINYYEYTGTEASVANLYHYLTVSSTSLTRNLNMLLRKKFKCDVTEIGKYNIYFSTLLLQGTVMNEVYWKLIGLNPTNREARHAQMFQNVYRAQIAAVDFCLQNYEESVKEDVLEIGKSHHPSNKQIIADQVKKRLDEKYNWYKWMVVVYNTDQDKNHILLGLTKIEVGEVIVAVGYTLKEEEYKDKVIEMSNRCFSEQCDQVTNQISSCSGVLPGPGRSEIIYFKDYGKLSHIAGQTEFIEVPKPLHHVQCQWGWSSRGTLSVHLSGIRPRWQRVTCENRGTLKNLLDSGETLCECQDGYYGDRCEHRMDTSMAEKISTRYPLPTVSNTSSKLKRMESKLQEIADAVRRC